MCVCVYVCVYACVCVRARVRARAHVSMMSFPTTSNLHFKTDYRENVGTVNTSHLQCPLTKWPYAAALTQVRIQRGATQVALVGKARLNNSFTFTPIWNGLQVYQGTSTNQVRTMKDEKLYASEGGLRVYWQRV